MKFHSKNPDLILSGSTDGLICVFDISQTDEDDALLCTLNTESSVGNINWHETALGKNLVSCITHTNDFQLYNAEDFDDAELLKSFDRETVTQHMKVISKFFVFKRSSNCFNSRENRPCTALWSIVITRWTMKFYCLPVRIMRKENVYAVLCIETIHSSHRLISLEINRSFELVCSIKR